jgi:hypothetical protein
MAREAEAASPCAENFENYCAAHVQRSASSQIIAENDSINDVMNIKQSRQNYKSKKGSETIIISKEPTYSLGGYSYQKHRSPTRRNKKKQKFFTGYNDARIARSKYF